MICTADFMRSARATKGRGGGERMQHLRTQALLPKEVFNASFGSRASAGDDEFSEFLGDSAEKAPVDEDSGKEANPLSSRLDRCPAAGKPRGTWRFPRQYF